MDSVSREKPLRWGVLGTSRTAWKRMIPAILRTPGNTVEAILGRDAEKTHEFGQRFNIRRRFVSDRFDVLLEDPDIDVIYIPLPSALHAEIACAALLAGKHVLCEKPLALTLEQARRLITIQGAAGRVLVENFSYHLAPGYALVRELVESLTLGAIRSVQMVLTFAAERKHAFRFSRELGGGCLYDLTCYGIDLAHRLFGERLGESVLRAVPLTTKLATLGDGSSVEGRVWASLEALGGIELSIYTAFEGARQDLIILAGEKMECFVPAIFLPDEKGSAAFVRVENDHWIRELPGLDPNSLQIHLLCARIREDRILDLDDQKRWEWNASVLEELHRKVASDLGS
jgi:predicted dehydrogenase